MRGKLALLVLGLLPFGPGCTLLTDSAHTLVRGVTDTVDDAREGLRNRRWAEEAWQGVRAAAPGPYSDDYARGFQSGFADYLDKGGSGEPPVLAPPRYRHLRYQTPQGYTAIEEWFAGYRHGAEVARQSGWRQWITGPTSLRPPGGADPSGAIVLTPTPPANLGMPVPGENVPETLPAPRRLLPGAVDGRAWPTLLAPLRDADGVVRHDIRLDGAFPDAPAPVLIPIGAASAPGQARRPVTEKEAAPSPEEALRQTRVLLIPPAAAGPSGEAPRGPVLGPARGDEE